MGADGPTTAGSIRAELILDSSDFMSKLAAADAAARKLGSVDPNIDVDVQAGDAISKLAAVDAAANRLDGSTRRLAVAQGALNSANGAGIQRWQLIAAAIAALIPLLAPLAGYAIGVTGALAGMGAAGGLAIYGLIKAMRDGTAAGGEWKNGLIQLKSVLDSLANTAANALLGSFKQAISQINTVLPILNEQIRTFSQILGVAGNAALTGVLNALRILNPVFVQASKYVLDLARGFQTWTQNGGLQQFANYAITQLPIVADALGSVATAALHIVAALAPIGTVVVQALTLVGQAINAIPLPVIMDVAAAAGAAFAAFKLWGLIQPILSTVASSIGAVGVATQLATGPIGWVTAGVSALAAVLSVNAQASQEATQAAADYAAALRQDNDAIGANVRATAAKRLQDENALDAARKIGVSTQAVVDATLGDVAAKKLLSAAISDVQDKTRQLQAAHGGLTKAEQQRLDASTLLAQVTGAENSQIQDQINKSRQLSSAIGKANSDTATSTDLITALRTATDATADATDKLAQQLRGLGQVNLDASTANIQYQQSLADASAALAQNGATLDLNTQKGRENQRALDSIASSGIGLVAAQSKTGASTDQLTATMAAARQGFIDTAIKMGATAEQANALADQYGLIPKNVATAVQVTGVDDARNKVIGLQQWINNLHGKTVFVDAVVNAPAGAPGRGNVGFRDGGTIPLHAATGLTVPGSGASWVDSVPAMLAPLEEIISNRYGQASNNRVLLKAINSGARPMQIAQIANRQAGASASQAPVNVYVSSNGVDLTKFIDVRVEQGGRELFRQAATQLRAGRMF
ncbi:hypothetical protein ACRAWB_01895 [Leifsonia poae]|uniref:hypothetical protein n=1 Tax=Leifsonia poae TaxID=110933 RepID=UPI003D69163E